MTTSQQDYSHQYIPPPLHLESAVAGIVTGDSAIDQLDLRKIIAKSMDSYSGYGWDAGTALQLANLYRIFLFICKTYPDETIVPPKDVDDFWHLHILDTRNYISDCETIFGSYLHHYPYAGLDGSSSLSEEEKYQARTMELVARHFPSVLTDDDETEGE